MLYAFHHYSITVVEISKVWCFEKNTIKKSKLMHYRINIIILHLQHYSRDFEPKMRSITFCVERFANSSHIKTNNLQQRPGSSCCGMIIY